MSSWLSLSWLFIMLICLSAKKYLQKNLKNKRAHTEKPKNVSKDSTVYDISASVDLGVTSCSFKPLMSWKDNPRIPLSGKHHENT